MIGFRVTNQMILDQVITNLQLNEQGLEHSQQQVSTGLTISQPSDDPFAASQIVTFHQRMGLNTQLQTNLDSAKGWLDTTDNALNGIDNLIQRARQLAIQGANDTQTSADRQDIALEIHQILLNAVDIGNSKFGSQFVFAGTKTTQQPFIHDGSTKSPNISTGSPSPVKYFGDSSTVTRQIDQAAQLGVNVDGSNFNSVFADLAQLEYDLNNDGSRVAGSIKGIDLKNGTTSGFTGTADTFSINGIRIGVPVNVTLNGQQHTIIGFAPSTPISQVVDQINAQSSQTGVQASVDDSGVLVLQLVPGSTQSKIVISNVDAVTQDANGNDLTSNTGVPVATGGDTQHDLGLSSSPENAIGSVDVFALDRDLQVVDTLRSQIGAKTNRVTEGQNRLSALGITLTSLNSKFEDVDMAKAVSDLATKQTTFQAALGAAGKVLPPTLLDFLR